MSRGADQGHEGRALVAAPGQGGAGPFVLSLQNGPAAP